MYKTIFLLNYYLEVALNVCKIKYKNIFRLIEKKSALSLQISISTTVTKILFLKI